MLVICLIEKDVFSISCLRCKVFKSTVPTDAVLGTELPPELLSDYGSKRTRERMEMLARLGDHVLECTDNECAASIERLSGVL